MRPAAARGKPPKARQSVLDALQLAAAIVAAEHEPASLPFVSLDERLNDAAAREGFQVLPGS